MRGSDRLACHLKKKRNPVEPGGVITARPSSERHVLIVDDNLADASALASRLERHSLRPHITASGVAALDMLHAAEFDGMVVAFRVGDTRADLLLLVALALHPHLERRTVLLMTEPPPTDIQYAVVRMPCQLETIERAVLAALEGAMPHA